jgi:hypothetical protein
MPIYEYYSYDTNKIYKFFATSISQKDVVPKCPDGEEFRMERMLSSFAITGKTRKSRKDGEAPMSINDVDMEDPRVKSLFREMEKTVEGMDPENPDPRIMGRFLRRIGDTLGDKFDDEVEEVIRKLEEGHDPESLEQNFEGVLGESDDPYDNFGGMGGMPSGHDGDDNQQEKDPKGFDIRGESKKILRMLRPPARDPKLYTYE